MTHHRAPFTEPPLTNWGGTHTYRASRIERPSTLSDLQRLIASPTQTSAIATRHSFDAIGDGSVLIDLAALASPPVVDHERDVVSVAGATTYAQLSEALAAEGRALHNLASLPHISVAGAVATGTHGSGSSLGGLATAVESIEMITATGDLAIFHRGDPDFDGAVVHLGTLGLVTRLVLRTEPAYTVAQTVFDGLDWSTLTASFDDLFAAATSVSVFTRWGDTAGEVWCKQRVGEARPTGPIGDLSPATEARHPIVGQSPAACTEQGGVAGPWWDRLPHFRADAQPSAGAEIQSEFFVGRGDAGAAITALRGIGQDLAPVLYVSEIRTIAADDLWTSPCEGRESVAFHFTWRPVPPAVTAAVALIEAALAPFAARPHWGKFGPSSWRASTLYPRLDEFVGLKHRLDPDGRFTSDWLARHLR